MDDGVPNGPVAEPAGVAPVQTLRPGCRREAGQHCQHFLLSAPPENKSEMIKAGNSAQLQQLLQENPQTAGKERSLAAAGQTSVQLLVRRQRSVLLRAGPFGLSIGELVAAIFTLIWKHHTCKEQ